jgi:hypothetical protein
MMFQYWGATQEEIDSSVVGDDLCTNATVVATRCITIPAPPENVFPWIRQMGFGRAGWYSYDWLDNLGRKSATRVHEEWQHVNTGDAVPAGPTSFRAAIVNSPQHFVLEVKNGKKKIPRLHFTLAYELRPSPEGTRLVTRMRSHINVPGGKMIERLILGPGDGIMLRRQLLTLAARVTLTATSSQQPPTK